LVTKDELIALTEVRVQEASVLGRAGFVLGASYLLGYALECAIKAILAGTFRAHTIPDKRFVLNIHTHELPALVAHANLSIALQERIKADQAFAANWNVVRTWSEEIRYQVAPVMDYASFETAVLDETAGILPWIRTHW
jgi:hypothetical protein